MDDLQKAWDDRSDAACEAVERILELFTKPQIDFDKNVTQGILDRLAATRAHASALRKAVRHCAINGCEDPTDCEACGQYQ